jgi:hypothetical protein
MLCLYAADDLLHRRAFDQVTKQRSSNVVERPAAHYFGYVGRHIHKRFMLGLIRFRGHFPKGGYDVHDGNNDPG